MKILRILPVILALSSLHASAASNWDDGYRPYQDVAPEYLEIEINKVITDAGSSFYASSSRVTIEARVSKVFRSATGLVNGTPLTITYTRKSQAGTAILEPTTPQQGSVVPAFLRKKGNRYEPAALHHSFVPLTPQQLQVLNNLKIQPNQQTARVDVPKTQLKKITPPVDSVTDIAPEPIPQPAVPVDISEIPIENHSTADTVVPALIVTEPRPFIDGDQPIVSPLSSANTEKEEPIAISVIQEPMPEREIIAAEPTEPDVTALQQEEKIAQDVQNSSVQVEEKKSEQESLPVAEVAPIVLKAEPIEEEKSTVETTVETAQPAQIQVVPEPVQNTFNDQTPAAVAPPAPSSEGVDQDGVSTYSMIFAKIKEADSAVEKNDFAAAKTRYESALIDLKKLKETKPDFQPFIVEYRRRDITRKLKALENSSQPTTGVIN